MSKLTNFITQKLQRKGIFISRNPSIKYFNLVTDQIVADFLSRSTGVLHIGAYEAEERFLYESFQLDVLWIEALPDTFKVLNSNIASLNRHKALNVLLGDKDVDLVDFNVSSNGQSSSLLEFSNEHTFEGVNTARVIQVPMRMLDTVALGQKISRYDFWVIDVQGAELLVLNGSVKSIAHCKYLLIEVSTIEFYKGGVLWTELKLFLDSIGFVPVWIPDQIRHLNVLFIRTNNPSIAKPN